MINLLEQFITLPQGISLKECALLFMLIFTRWLVMTTMIPFFGALLLPALVRVSLASCMSMVSFWFVINSLHTFVYPSSVIIALLFLKEALLGFIIGFLASLIFYAYELFGQFMDFARAASMAKLLVPEMKHQSSPMGTFMFQLSLVVFIGLGLHREVIQTIFYSFERFGVLSLDIDLLNETTLMSALQIMASLFSIAFSFALPVIFICFLIDLAFGLMNRVAPQINAYFLSLPAKIIGGIIILFFMLPFLLEDFIYYFQELSQYLHQFLS